MRLKSVSNQDLSHQNLYAFNLYLIQTNEIFMIRIIADQVWCVWALVEEEHSNYLYIIHASSTILSLKVREAYY